MTCSPFLLGGVLNEDLKRWETKYPNLVQEIRDGLYVDDLMTGGESVETVTVKREKVVEVFEDGTFKLHKWHSNVASIEENVSDNNEKPSLGTTQLGTNKRGTKLFGLTWDKTKDTLSVETTQKPVTTKREALSELAKIYDPLGLVSPTTLVAKQLYREMCEAKLPWDGVLTEEIKKRWEEWQVVVSVTFTVPRNLAPFFQPIITVTLHAFGDASKLGVSAAVYAIVEQKNGTTQGLVCSKSRLAKKNLTILRLELVAAHMARNLVVNVERAIETVVKVVSVHCWSDSTVTLYWMNGQGEYRQFVSNRVAKIKEQTHVQWHHVPTEENPADLESRGSKCVDSELWRQGPDWLSDPSKWPNIVLEPSQESRAEAKSLKNVFTTKTEASRATDQLDELLEAHELRKVLKIGAWIRRFNGQRASIWSYKD